MSPAWAVQQEERASFMLLFLGQHPPCWPSPSDTFYCILHVGSACRLKDKSHKCFVMTIFIKESFKELDQFSSAWICIRILNLLNCEPLSASRGCSRGDVMFSLCVCVAGKDQHAAGVDLTLLRGEDQETKAAQWDNVEKSLFLLFSLIQSATTLFFQTCYEKWSFCSLQSCASCSYQPCMRHRTYR